MRNAYKLVALFTESFHILNLLGWSKKNLNIVRQASSHPKKFLVSIFSVCTTAH